MYITHFEQVTAKRAISQVVFSRIVMAVPGMGMFIHTTVHMRDMVQVVYTLSSYSAILNEPPRKEELLQGIYTLVMPLRLYRYLFVLLFCRECRGQMLPCKFSSLVSG